MKSDTQKTLSATGEQLELFERYYVYRPTGESRVCGAVLYDSQAMPLGFHVSSSLSWAKADMQRHINKHVPAGTEVQWVIGEDEWNALVDAGALPEDARIVPREGA